MLCDTYDANQFSPWPTCDMHYNLATKHEEFTSWVWKSQGAPHGPVHVWIGGVFNCDEAMATISALIGSENADALQLYVFDWRKTLWIDGYFSCEGRATAHQTEDDVRPYEGNKNTKKGETLGDVLRMLQARYHIRFERGCDVPWSLQFNLCTVVRLHPNAKEQTMRCFLVCCNGLSGIFQRDVWLPRVRPGPGR